MKKLLVLLMSLVLALGSCALFGCGGDQKTKEGCLTIRYFKGGYGDEWLKDSLFKFLSEKKGVAISELKEGVDYKLIPDTQVTSNQVNYLKSENNVPDILMTQGGFDQYIEQGLIENLDDVYNATVKKLNGTTIKVKDYINPAVYNAFTRQMKYNTGKAYSWAIPWNAESFSLAYNEDLLFATEHNATSLQVGDDIVVGSNWTRVPKTVDELASYLNDVTIANGKKEPKDQVVPFGYTMKGGLQMQFLVDIWWAQIQGVSESNIEGEKSFYDFFNFNDINLLNQTGIEKALQTLQDLIYDKTSGKYINSDVDANLKGLDAGLHYKYASEGKYAIWVAGDYFENENKDANNFYVNGKPRFTAKMMNVPNAKSYDKDGNATGFTDSKVCLIRTDEASYIPSKAVNKALAKEFLAYMCNESELLNFSKKTGGILPFDYNPSELDPSYAWTDFQKSFFDTYNGAEIAIEAPANVTDQTKISPIYVFNRMSIHFYMTYNWTQMFNFESFKKEPKKLMEEVVNNTKNQFNKWKTQYAQYFKSLK